MALMGGTLTDRAVVFARHGTQMNDLNDLLNEIEQDDDVRLAAVENNLRRDVANALEARRLEKGLSIRALVKEMGTSALQVQRVLHREQGGNLTLRTLVRAADALDFEVSISFKQVLRGDVSAVSAAIS
jgi:hypothetical protein